MIKKLSSLLFFSILGVFLASCGNQVCIMGFGSCEAPEKPITVQTNKTLTLTAPKTSILTQEQLTFSVTGGTSPFKFEIASGLGTLSNFGSFTAQTTSIYTAPPTPGTITINVTDSTVPAKTQGLAVVVGSR